MMRTKEFLVKRELMLIERSKRLKERGMPSDSKGIGKLSETEEWKLLVKRKISLLEMRTETFLRRLLWVKLSLQLERQCLINVYSTRHLVLIVVLAMMMTITSLTSHFSLTVQQLLSIRTSKKSLRMMKLSLMLVAKGKLKRFLTNNLEEDLRVQTSRKEQGPSL